jgi:hypothetical protein
MNLVRIFCFTAVQACWPNLGVGRLSLKYPHHEFDEDFLFCSGSAVFTQLLDWSPFFNLNSFQILLNPRHEFDDDFF